MFMVEIDGKAVGPYIRRADAEAVAKGMTRGKWVAMVVDAPGPLPSDLVRPNPSIGNFHVGAFTVEYFVPTGEVRHTKKGEAREEMLKCSMIRVHVRDKRSGLVWYYTGTTRQGRIRYSDSRFKGNPSMSGQQFRDEIVRMMGEDGVIAISVGVTNRVKMAEYKDIMGQV